MKWTILLLTSIGINLLLIVSMISKKQSKPSELMHTVHELLEVTDSEMDKISKMRMYGVQGLLDRFPLIKGPLNDCMSPVRREAESAIHALDSFKIASKQFDQRTALNKYYGNEIIQDSLAQVIHSFIDSLQNSYHQALHLLEKPIINVDSMLITEKQFLADFDFQNRLQQLQGLNFLEAEIVINSLQLDLRNLEYFYINEITKFIPQRSVLLDQLKLYAFTNQKNIKKGEEFTIEIGVASYASQFWENSIIEINGKEYSLNKNGCVNYEELPQRLGKHTIELTSKVTNPLTGERFKYSSTFPYEVVK